MLLKRAILERVVEGKVTLVFRRWKRPTVKSGGTLRTALGVLAIDKVQEVDENTITESEAVLAGCGSLEELLGDLADREGRVYRVQLHWQGDDPRIQLREAKEVGDQELAELSGKLERMDARSKRGPWTLPTLTLIAQRPGQRAPDLAELLGMETKPFKTNVRKLKELGLTESLRIGYQLSPRGEVVLAQLQKRSPASSQPDQA